MCMGVQGNAENQEKNRATKGPSREGSEDEEG